MKKLLCFALCVVALAACKDDEPESASTATDPAPTTDRAAPPPNAAARPAPEPAAPPAFDHGAFCRQVFPVGEVARALGQADMQAQMANRPPMPGAAECSYARYTNRPEALATAVFDCRPQHPRLPTTVARLLKVDKGRYYRDVDIGEGGAYARDQANNNHQELAFLTAEPACAVYVSTSYVAEDRTEALARIVESRLSIEIAPKL